MKIYDNRDQFMLINAIASEYTAADFVANASNAEGAILQEDGQLVAGQGDKFRVVCKDSNGVVHKSPIIDPKQIKSFTKTAPATAIPEYSYFTVDTTGLAAKDHYEVFIRTYGLGSESVMDQYEKTVFHTYATGETASQLAASLGQKLYGSFATFFRNKNRKVYNKAGYDKIFETEAAVITGKATLTDTKLIWVIANEKAYTVADKTALTFATICTEKTNWATELAANPPTAAYVPATKYWDFVQVNDTTVRMYVCAKAVASEDDKFDGVNAITRVAAAVWDESAAYKTTDVTVTYKPEVINPGAGKMLRGKQISLDKAHRQYGKFAVEEYTPTFDVSKTTNYWVVDIKFDAEDVGGEHQRTAPQKGFGLTIACDDDTTASTIITTLNGVLSTFVDHAIADHTDVLLTDPAENEILKLNDEDVWVNADDEVE